MENSARSSQSSQPFAPKGCTSPAEVGVEGHRPQSKLSAPCRGRSPARQFRRRQQTVRARPPPATSHPASATRLNARSTAPSSRSATAEEPRLSAGRGRIRTNVLSNRLSLPFSIVHNYVVSSYAQRKPSVAARSYASSIRLYRACRSTRQPPEL